MIAGARVERFKQEVNTFDPFGLFVRNDQRGEQEHGHLPGRQFRAGDGRQLEPAPELRRDGQPARVPRAGRVRVHRRRRQPRHQGQSRPPARPHPQRRRPLGNVHRQPRRRRRAASSTSTSTSRSSASCSRRRTPLATFQNSDNARNTGLELEVARDLGRHFFVNANYTFVDSKITLLPNQLATQTSLERPLAGQSKNLFNMTFEGTAGGFAAASALQLLRRPHLRRRRQRRARHPGTGPRQPGLRHVAAHQRAEHPADAREPDRQRVSSSRRAIEDSAHVQARARRSRCHSATTSSKRHSYGAFKDNYEEINPHPWRTRHLRRSAVSRSSRRSRPSRRRRSTCRASTSR